ncbi:TolC family protein, partial [Parabacteroides distasonis]|uniref:TolC family protein n=1 Tax=Parabacteroides distasonis TaxID=823 RepID=UPI00325AA66C
SYSGNYALNAKWTLFDGGQRVQAIKQQEIQNTVDELGIEQNEDDIQISLIQTYMQVLYAMESVRINQNTVEVSTAQRDRAVELLRAGSISKVDLAQLESQLSTDKYQLVVAQTNLDNYKLQLKQLLELDITEEIELVMPELTEKDILTPLPSKQTIYNTSLAVMPQIKSSELAVDIAELEKN